MEDTVMYSPEADIFLLVREYEEIALCSVITEHGHLTVKSRDIIEYLAKEQGMINLGKL